MRTVELLLREPVQDLGVPGDVVLVAAGYARNYLLPRHMAVAATAENKRIVAKRRTAYDSEMREKAAQLEALASALEGVVIQASEKADANGHLYGSVNPARIAELLVAAGHLVVEKQVRVDAPIRKCGEHGLRIHLHEDQYASIVLKVSAEGANA